MIPSHRRPTHPGNILLHEFLEPFGLHPKDLARHIGVSTRIIGNILRERGRISPELALRLAQFFGTTPDFWLNLQHNVDMWDTLQTKRFNIQAITLFAARARRINAVLTLLVFDALTNDLSRGGDKVGKE